MKPLTSISFVPRLGHEVVADEVFWARSSGDLPRMLAALDIRTNLVDRHFLLAAITEHTYKLREDPAMARLCEQITAAHVSEYPRIKPALNSQNDGIAVTTKCFHRLATVLSERGEAREAIAIAKKALRHGQVDEAFLAKWIKRLEKAAEKYHAQRPPEEKK